MRARDLIVSLLIAVIASAPAVAFEIAPAVELQEIETEADAKPGTEASEDLKESDAGESEEGQPPPPNRLEGPALHRPDTDTSRPIETVGGAEPDLPLARAESPHRIQNAPRKQNRAVAIHQVELRTEQRAGLGALPPPHVTNLSPQR